MGGLRSMVGAGIGAGLMYLLDPVSGRRRRATLRDKAVHVGHRTEDAMGKTWRDVSNRTHGLVAEGRGLLRRNGGDRRDIAGDGDGRRAGRAGRMRLAGAGYWSPARRFFVGIAGAALSLVGLARRGWAGAALGAAGLGLLARGAANMPVRRMVGMKGGRHAVDIQKTLHIDAPVHEVYGLWSAYENFPRFMSHVREVRRLGPDRSHWVVEGPAGTPIEWDAQTTEVIPNHLLAWKTLPNMMVEHEGRVRFDPAGDHGTRVTVQMSYTPIGGGVGHVLADLLGSDPKARMDEDLNRMKMLLEEKVAGMRSQDGA